MSNSRRFVARSQVFLASAVVAGAAAGISSAARLPGAPPKRDTPLASQPELKSRFFKLPIAFEANRGQAASPVRYLSHGQGFSLLLGANEAVMTMRRPDKSIGTLARGGNTTVRMKIVGANPHLQARAEKRLPGVVNYYLGNDPKKWCENVPTFSQVRYAGAYPGVDLLYYGNQEALEYDFVVKPGASTSRIRVAFPGARGMRLDSAGNLLLQVDGGTLLHEKPYVYQERAGKRVAVAGSFVLNTDSSVGFRVGAYDHRRPLVIDPSLKYCTFLGGTNYDKGFGIAVDSSQNAVVLGETASSNFPTTAGTAQTGYAGTQDAFVAKFNPTGSSLLYCTYLGGTSQELGRGAVALDSSGNAYVCGYTQSSNFPVKPVGSPLRTWQGGTADGFVSKLSSTGTLTWSTFLGGSSGEDACLGLALSPDQTALYVVGVTRGGFLTTAGAYQTTIGAVGARCGFITSIKSDGSAFNASTYYGGANNNQLTGIAVDSSGYLYVCGEAGGGTLDVGGNVGEMVSVAKFSPTLDTSSRVYGIAIDGTGAEDVAMDIAVDSAGSAYVTGWTRSSVFPTRNAIKSTLSGNYDAFVTKVNAATTGSFTITNTTNTSYLDYSTYLGGSADEQGRGIAVDSSGQAYVAGSSNSSNFPTVSPLTITGPNGTYNGAVNSGATDVFLTKLNASGSAILFSTYLGSIGNDEGRRLAVNTNGIVWLTGVAGGQYNGATGVYSSTFPITTGAYNNAGANFKGGPASGGFNNGPADAFVARIKSTPNQSPSVTCPVAQCASVTAPTTITASVSDPDGDALTVTWKVNGTTVATHTVAGSVLEPLNSSDSLTYTFPAGPNTVVVSVSDGIATAVSCSTTITGDNVPPTVTAPANILTTTDPGHCYATVSPGTATATDNCTSPVTPTGTRSDSQPLTATYPVGVTTITWSATDAFGNTGTATQTVTVQDTTAPSIATVPPNISVTTDSMQTYATLTATQLHISDFVATDNCSSLTIVAFRDNPGLSDSGLPADLAGQYPRGTSIITWIAMDSDLNFITYQQRVTVTDGNEITSDFASNDDSWVQSRTPTSLTYHSSGGSSFITNGGSTEGGYVSSQSDGGSPSNGYFVAPAKFLGNHSTLNGRLLEFDLRQGSTSPSLSATYDVLLAGGGTTLVKTIAAPNTSWTFYSIGLTSNETWTVMSTGLPATDADLATVMGNITALQIRAHYNSSGDDHCDLDNVRLGAYYAAP